jgi:hypothetical protein
MEGRGKKKSAEQEFLEFREEITFWLSQRASFHLIQFLFGAVSTVQSPSMDGGLGNEMCRKKQSH